MIKHICGCGSENIEIMSVVKTINELDVFKIPYVNITYICNDCGYSEKEHHYLYESEKDHRHPYKLDK